MIEPPLIDLLRVSQSDEETLGVLRFQGWAFAVTLEPPWLDNQENVSCIPAGHYECRRVQSPHFGETFEIVGVPGRTHVLLHRGNSFRDTKACVLVAEEFAGTQAAPLVASSDRGFKEFLHLVEGRSAFPFAIKESYVTTGD